MIKQDSKGYLWLGTYGGGLNRWDGNDFVIYDEDNQLIGNVVWTVLADSKGAVWAGTNKGLNKIYKDTIIQYTEFSGLSGTQVWSIIEDSEGRILIGTNNNGIDIYDGQKFTNLNANDGLGFNGISFLMQGTNDDLWIGSNGSGLSRYRNSKFQAIPMPDGSLNFLVTSIEEGGNGEILVGTNNGLFIVTDDTLQPTQISTVLQSANIGTIFYNPNDHTHWIGTQGKGLFRVSKDGQILQFSENNGLSSDFVNCIFQDNGLNYWIGTDGGGLNKFEGEMFTYLNKENGLPKNDVMTIVRTSDGAIWYGNSGGATRFLDGKITNIDESKGLPNASVAYITEDLRKNIWIGTLSGLTKFDGTKAVAIDDECMKNVAITGMVQVDENTMWAATYNGIIIGKYNSSINRFQFKSAFDSAVGPIKVYAIHKKADGSIWLGTEQGMISYNNEKFKYYYNKNELPTDIIAITSDPFGRTWYASDKGVGYIDDGTGGSISKSGGLSSNHVYLLTYFDQSIWVGTERGIDRIQLDSTGKVTGIRHYGKTEGFYGGECNANAVLVEPKDSVIWIGTVNGVSKMDLRYDKPNSVTPIVHLNGIRLAYAKLDWKTYGEGFEVKSGLPVDLKLDYRDNHITFDFCGIEFKNPEKLAYRFKLEGFDEDWQPLTSNNLATYNYLKYGNYLFRVKAQNSDGVWSSEISYPFTIVAPFWKKTTFYVLSAATLILLMFLYAGYRSQLAHKKRRQLESIVNRRTRELAERNKELKKLSIVASQMNEAVLILDIGGKVEYLNDSFVRNTGFSRDEFHAKYGNDLKIQEISSNSKIEEIIKSFQTSPEAVSYDSPHETKDGGTRWTSASVSPIYNYKDELENIVVVYSDITERVENQAKLEQKNKDITDSIKYAKQIQEAILPSIEGLKTEFPESFIFYEPRDIVSGDFYWFTRINEDYLVVAADCTGHGVPGALMSMIGNEFLHEIAKDQIGASPDLALVQLDQKINRALQQDVPNTKSRDGMDIAMCSINTKTGICQFAGAYNPLYLVREGELSIFDANKESVGGYKNSEKKFSAHEIQLEVNDELYLFSDGYMDQFGGPKNKKFMKSRFKQLITSLHLIPMEEQQKIIESQFLSWKGPNKQVDDVLVMGLRYQG